MFEKKKKMADRRYFPNVVRVKRSGSPFRHRLARSARETVMV